MEPKFELNNLSQQLQNLQQSIDEGTLLALARESEFTERKARKLTGLLTFKLYTLAGFLSATSYRTCAMLAGLLGGFTISKQGLKDRIDSSAQKFLELCLSRVLTQRLQEKQSPHPGWLMNFNRVMVQDSTTIKIPEKWAGLFPGSRNQHQQRPKAQLKIQAVLDICVHRFVCFAITPFTSNDQSSAGDAAALARPGDLWLRDLGYFVLDSFKEIARAGAGFLSRFRHSTNLYDLDGKPLKLMDLLHGNTHVDRKVLLGKEHQLPVRLLAVALPAPVAGERRRKARADRDKRLNHNDAYFQALGWAIFITNLDEQTMSLKQAAELYGLRWRVETVFKSWKSNFHMAEVPQEISTDQLLCLLTGRLIYCVLFEVFFTSLWFADYCDRPAYSHIKLSQLYWMALPVVLLNQAIADDPLAWSRQIDYHCRYEKRRRQNFIQRFDSLT